MLITDDYSRYRWFYALKHKSEAHQVLENWITLMRNQGHGTPKRLRADCGKEFINRKMKNWATKFGAHLKPTALYSQSQNGVAERSIYTIISRARTMLHATSDLPKELWAEAVNTAVYLTNLSPTKAIIKGKTPYELFHGTKPTYKHLRTFGCAAYAIDHHAKSKFASRSRKMRLLGYDATTIFRLWDPVKEEVRTSRDVIFNELDIDSQAVGVASTTSEAVGVTSTTSEAVGDTTLPDGPWVVIPARQTNPEEDDSDSDSGGIPIAMLAKTHGTKDPNAPSYKETIESPEAHLWRQAVQKELNNHETRKTFTLVRPPANRKILTGKWVFKRKRNENGEIIEYKARWVLRGFEQQKGTDYGDTYVAVVRNETTRLLLSLCAVNN